MQETTAKQNLINLENLENSDINEILEKYFIESETDDDGDLIIDASARIYIKVDNDEKILRFFSFVRTKDGSQETEFSLMLENINRASYTVKYSIMKTSVMVEYGIPLFGHIDHKHLIKVIHHIDGEIKLLKLRASEYIEG